MLKSFKFLIMVSLLFFGFGVSTTSANDDIGYLWNEAEGLPSETMIISEGDDKISTRDVKYIKWGKGTMNISVVASNSRGEIVPAGYLVSRITATGKTIREHSIGNSAVTTILMRDGRELGRKSDSSTLSKTATASVATFPGSVFPKTEYRAHGTHAITKGVSHSVGYTGESLKF